MPDRNKGEKKSLKGVMMKERRFIVGVLAQVFVLFLGWSVLLSVLFGQRQAKRSYAGQNYNVSLATSKIKVDGVLDENAWKDALVLSRPRSRLSISGSMNCT